MINKQETPVPIASRLYQFIDRKGLSCQPMHHSRSASLGEALESANVVPDLCVRTIAMIDVKGVVVAVVPFLADLDLPLINSTLNRNLQLLPDTKADKLFVDCEPGSHPPFGMAYGVPVIVDVDMLDNDHFYAASGCASTLLRIDGRSFRQAMTGAIKGKISVWNKDTGPALGAGLNACNANMTAEGVAKKLEQLYKLPAMPATAVRVMHLTSDPEATAQDLAEVVEPDPSLVAQIMRYAKSALFAYRGELHSVRDAIHAVLGFDRVSQLAMGIAAAKAFAVPTNGPLGLTAFWKHTLYCATLSAELGGLLNKGGVERQVNLKDVYLSALLHNFGLLLVGHLFPPEFKLLNKLRETEPDATLEEIEKQVFGMGGAQDIIALGHGTIGGILFKMWDLPALVSKVAAMHQKMAYTGDYADYVNIVQLANNYLSRQGVGDDYCDVDPQSLLDLLGLEKQQTDEIVTTTLDNCEGLDAMIKSMGSA